MNTFNIMAIDPGNNTGISVYTIDNDLNIINIVTHFYNLENYVNNKITVDRMLDKLMVLRDIITNLLNTYDPLVVVEEAAFMNMRFPKAVMILSQLIAVVETSVMTYNKDIKMFRYPPKYIKKYIGASGNADKNDMLTTISGISDITKFININTVNEHEIDSLAIGYIAYNEIKDFPYILWCN